MTEEPVVARFYIALSGHPERMKMGKPSRGRGGAAHAGGARGVTPRSNPFFIPGEQRESDAQPYALISWSHRPQARRSNLGHTARLRLT
jgi:hypothetical protein